MFLGTLNNMQYFFSLFLRGRNDLFGKNTVENLDGIKFHCVNELSLTSMAQSRARRAHANFFAGVPSWAGECRACARACGRERVTKNTYLLTPTGPLI